MARETGDVPRCAHHYHLCAEGSQGRNVVLERPVAAEGEIEQHNSCRMSAAHQLADGLCRGDEREIGLARKPRTHAPTEELVIVDLRDADHLICAMYAP